MNRQRAGVLIVALVSLGVVITTVGPASADPVEQAKETACRAGGDAALGQGRSQLQGVLARVDRAAGPALNRQVDLSGLWTDYPGLERVECN